MLQKNILQKLPTVVVFFLQSSKTNLHVESFKVTRCYQLPKYRRIFSVVSDIEGLSFFVPSPTLNQSNSKKLTWTHPKLWKLAWPSHCNQIAKNWEFQTVSDFVFLCYSLNLWSIAAYMECSCKRYLLWQGKKGHLIWPRNIKITILIAYWNMGGACVVVRGLSH